MLSFLREADDRADISLAHFNPPLPGEQGHMGMSSGRCTSQPSHPWSFQIPNLSLNVEGAPSYHTLLLSRVMYSSIWLHHKHVCPSHRSSNSTHADHVLVLVRHLDKGVSRPSMVRPPSGSRRLRHNPFGFASPLLQNNVAERASEPTPIRSSRLSGMGGSDCAERACRTARLSLELVSHSFVCWTSRTRD